MSQEKGVYSENQAVLYQTPYMPMPEPFAVAEARRGTRLVSLGEVGLMYWQPDGPKRQAIGTDHSYGSIAVAAVFRQRGYGSKLPPAIVVARHRPSGDAEAAAGAIGLTVRQMLPGLKVLERAVIRAPYATGKDVEGRRPEGIDPRAMPDVEGYTRALQAAARGGADGEPVVEVDSWNPSLYPDALYSPDRGSLLVSCQRDGDDGVQVRIFSEGRPV